MVENLEKAIVVPLMSTVGQSSSWPIGKLQANISKGIVPNTRLAVLLSTGGLNPIHNGHLDMFYRAKRCLESEHNFAVVGGFVSPSHDLYVGPKCEALKTFHFSANERLKLTQLACEESDWLECASWESEQEGYWPDFPEVLHALQQFLSSSVETKMHIFTVLYVCGFDHADKCSLHRGFGRQNQGVVIVPRSDMPPATSKPDLLVFGVTETNPAVEHLSSTVVRKALHDGTPIDPSWMPGPAAEEIRRIYNQKTALKSAPASPRVVFISLSVLIRELAYIPMPVLEDSLCFFGSKRMWIWPGDSKPAIDEAAQQPGDYRKMPDWLLELLLLKEARGEVHFLKPDLLGEDVVGDYAQASAWFARQADPQTGAPYGPLRLERDWWEGSFAGGRFLPRDKWWQAVANIEQGQHSYAEVPPPPAPRPHPSRAPGARRARPARGACRLSARDGAMVELVAAEEAGGARPSL